MVSSDGFAVEVASESVAVGDIVGVKVGKAVGDVVGMLVCVLLGVCLIVLQPTPMRAITSRVRIIFFIFSLLLVKQCAGINFIPGAHETSSDRIVEST